MVNPITSGHSIQGVAVSLLLRTMSPMKRINYDGVTLVTGSAVADALVEYAATVARMNTAASVEVPVLEDNGTIGMHTLLLSGGNSLEVLDIDGSALELEDERFPIPDFTPIGGKAVTVTTGEIPSMSLPIPEA
jgi:hypothetical protein